MAALSRGQNGLQWKQSTYHPTSLRSLRMRTSTSSIVWRGLEFVQDWEERIDEGSIAEAPAFLSSLLVSNALARTMLSTCILLPNSRSPVLSKCAQKVACCKIASIRIVLTRFVHSTTVCVCVCALQGTRIALHFSVHLLFLTIWTCPLDAKSCT